jgi:hypothetical protein
MVAYGTGRIGLSRLGYLGDRRFLCLFKRLRRFNEGIRSRSCYVCLQGSRLWLLLFLRVLRALRGFLGCRLQLFLL